MMLPATVEFLLRDLSKLVETATRVLEKLEKKIDGQDR